jgi:WD40 repeat protein
VYVTTAIKFSSLSFYKMVKEQEGSIKEAVPQKERFDDSFRSCSSASDYFKRKDRIRVYDSQDAIGIRSISWNRNGTMLVCGADNKGISVGSLDPRSSRLKQILAIFEHDSIVESVEFSKHDENVFASCSGDKTVQLFDVRTPKTSTKIQTNDSNLFLSWSNCGTFLAYGDKTDTISLLEIRTNKIMESVTFKDEINEFVCGGQRLFFDNRSWKVGHIKLT